MEPMREDASGSAGGLARGPATETLTRDIAPLTTNLARAPDGSAAHPDLYDREALAVLPFQASPTHFAIPIYVMTRDHPRRFQREYPHA